MNYTIGEAIDQCVEILLDEGQTQWEYDELLESYNTGCRDIVLKKPDANMSIENATLVAGPKQTIASNGIAFAKATRNIVGGNPGNAITPVDRNILDLIDPSWQTVTGTTVIHYSPDENDPLSYWVYPASPGANVIEIGFGKAPAQVTYDVGGSWRDELVGLREGYLDPIIHYVLHRSFSKDTGTVGNIERAFSHLTSYYQSLGLSMPRQQRR